MTYTESPWKAAIVLRATRRPGGGFRGFHGCDAVLASKDDVGP